LATSILPESAFETLKNNVTSSISAYFPFEGRNQKLVLDKIWVDDKLHIDDLKSQADHKNQEKTWGVPVKAEVSLLDKRSGKLLDKRQVTLAKLPKLTSRYGYIVDGSEYQVDHLFRLKSGVYAREQKNGDLESEFNLAKSPAGNFSLYLDQGKKQFFFKHGTTNIPLYPIMKAMGVSDEDMEKGWGQEIFAANRQVNPEKQFKALVKFHEKTAEEGASKPENLEGLVRHVHDFFGQTALRPDTTKVTLGEPFTTVTGTALKKAADKLLGVSRRTHEPDDRDSLAFKEILSAEDFLPERIERSARTIRGKMRQTVDLRQTIPEILGTGEGSIFNRPIREFFTKGGSLKERYDQTNPIQMLTGHRKTTLMAADFGGIKKDHSLTDEMRVINPSHFGFLDPMHTPESERTGITLHLGLGVRKNGKDLETPAYNLKSRKLEFVKAPEFHMVAAVLPDQVRWEKGHPVPIASEVKMKLPGGNIEVRPFKEATHVMPSAKGMFSPASNLIPFLPTDQGNRVSMADKQMEQAISIKHREAPLVQSRTDNQKDQSHSFEKVFGSFSSHRAPVGGKVVAVRPDAIVIHDGKKKHEIHLYNHFPLNDPKGMMHSEPSVKVGDSVKVGQHIADTNYTRNGVLALGTNLRVGYIPYKGYNYEDGIVISQTASKKLTSEHLYKKKIELDPEVDKIDKDRFKTYMGRKASHMTTDQWSLLGDDGIIRVGATVKPGQVLIAAVGKNTEKKASGDLAPYGKRAREPYRDRSLVWDEDHVGTVVEIIRDPAGKNHKVYVRTEEPMVVGDKLTGRHGNKGIITQILPDAEMPFTLDPKTKERRPLEVLLNPSGVPTRINSGQNLETAAAKIAEKTGQTYLVNNFWHHTPDYRSWVEAELKKHGFDESGEEHVYDPHDVRRPLGSVLVGPQYLLKLKHQVEKKLTVRGGGTDLDGRPLKYDQDMQPEKGGERGGQRFGALDIYALLGHNARHNLREMSTLKTELNDELWARIQDGLPVPTPKAPFVYEKFIGLLNGLGLNVVKKGTELQLQPLTDKHVFDMAGGTKGELKRPNFAVRTKDLREEAGGLFDPNATGGLKGTKWSFIRLAEPVPNPIFVGSNNRPGPIPVLLGMGVEDIDHLMAGKKKLDNGKTGGDAIKEALKQVNVGREIEATRARLPHLKGSDLDRANRKMRILMALKETGLRPEEAYVMHYLPVVPPVFRQVTATPRGDLHLPPVNGLYKNIGVTNLKLNEFDPKIHPKELYHPLRAELWEGVKALHGIGNAVGFEMDMHGGRRKLQGILHLIGGSSKDGKQPKDSLFQSKLVRHAQDLSIRSTIIPEPALGIDEVGLPKNAALELYKPFVVAELTNLNYSPLQAQQEMRRGVGPFGSPTVLKALQKVVEDRPLLLKRDPALHKFSVMAFKPRLIDGKAIQIHPLVTGGFNADFDGDTMAGTVPLTREAVDEAKKMFPSRNLFSPTTGGVMYTPSQEALLGLHLLTTWGKKTSKTFKDPVELNRAVDKGEVHATDVVTVNGRETTFGRLLVNSRLPKGFAGSQDLLHNPDFVIKKKTLSGMVTTLAKKHTSDFATVVDKLKDLGNEHAYRFGFSFGLKDLKPLKERDGILAEAHKEVAHLRKTVQDREKRDEAIVGVYQKATEKLEQAAENTLMKSGNRLAQMVYSGARGKPEQLRQMVAAPMLLQDATGSIIPTPVTRSYAEGLDVGDYWLAQHGARKGTMQRALGTMEPGAISKDILNTTMSTLITSTDCKTSQGILMSLKHKDIHDRHLAQNCTLKDGTVLKAGELVTPEVSNLLRNSDIKKVLVRSPLKCQHGDGVCAKCFGLNEDGKLHEIGTNIGVLAGQALGEPAVQMAMDAFHSGGIAGGSKGSASELRGASSVDRFTRLRQLLAMPKKLKGEATLARATGAITKVEPDPTGGVNIYIGKQRHLVPQRLVNETVTVGREVKRGDLLSHGLVNPRHLLESVRDIHAVQNHLVEELHSPAYGKDNDDRPLAQGLYDKEGVRRRNVEVVVRGLTNLTKVKDPGTSHWFHGDIAPRVVVEEHNRNLKKGERPVEHEPELHGVRQIPLTVSTDWMARLNYQQLANTIIQGAAQGWKSDLHGSHPVPGIAHGAEFGRPPSEVKARKPHAY
jgi:DNA-directed RNA polymerase subunit beta'